MGVCLDQAGPEIHAMAREVMEAHYPLLRLGEGEFVRLCILTAYRDDNSEEAPVKDGGYPAVGVISVIPYKQRVDKRADAEIILDAKAWRDTPEPEQRAILDGLIWHLEFQKDEQDAVKCDDIGRPKLKLRLCNWNLRGRREVAVRHGEHAPEVKAARAFLREYGDVVVEAEGAKLFA